MALSDQAVTDLPRFEPLGRNHNRAAFSCSHPESALYVQQLALQHARRKIAASTVLLVPDDTTIVAYHTLSATRLNLGELPEGVRKRLPNYAEGVPATLIGRLAVNSAFEKRGYGRGILMNALERALLATFTVASAFIIVRAINDDAAKFYMHYGFVPLPDDRRKLYLPMKTIEQLVAG